MGIQPALLKGLQPAVQREILLPRIQLGALAPRRLQHLAHPAVATGQHSLQKAGVGVVPVIGDGFGLDGLPQQGHPPLILLLGDLRLPLKGRMGLGNEPRCGDGDADAPVFIAGTLPPCMHDTGRHIGNAQHVLVGLRGQAQHEVQLHSVVAPGKSRAAGLKQILLGDIFIDDIP